MKSISPLFFFFVTNPAAATDTVASTHGAKALVGRCLDSARRSRANERTSGFSPRSEHDQFQVDPTEVSHDVGAVLRQQVFQELSVLQ